MIQPEDNRGDHLLDWIGSAELTILNDSHSSTRFSRTTGGLSSPDVTLAGSLIAPRCEWSVLEAIGNSDHLPLLTTINLVIEHQHVLDSVPRWKRTGVDWPKWSEAVESLCQSEPPKDTPAERLVRLTDIWISAANEHVGKTKPGKSNRTWLNADARDAIQDRNKKRKLFCNASHVSKICSEDERWESGSQELRDSITQQVKKSLKNDWLKSCEDTKITIESAKEESWKNLLEDAITEKDSTQLWGIIRSLNGTPSNNAPHSAMKHKNKTITCSKKKANIFTKHYANVSRLRLQR